MSDINFPHGNLKFGTLNVCGLKQRLQYPEFTKLINEFDIFCVTETKLDMYDIILLENFTFLSKPRMQKTKRKSGGIGVFIKSSLKDFIRIVESDCEYVL